MIEFTPEYSRRFFFLVKVKVDKIKNGIQRIERHVAVKYIIYSWSKSVESSNKKYKL